MPTISTGQSATVSVAAGGSIYITAGGFGRIRQGGQDQHFGPSQSTFGPYGAAQDVQITADTSVTYSTADPASVSGAGIGPVAVTGVPTVGQVPVAIDATNAAWGTPSGAGVSTFAALSDKTTVDMPAINTPLATALAVRGRLDTTLHNAFTVGAGNLTMTGVQNVGSGELCMVGITSGNYNTGYGYSAQQALTSGSYNTGIGNLAQQLITTGTANTGLGYQAGQRITTGSYNNALGFRAGGNVTTGSYNVSFGADCFFTATTATQNTHLGYKAGYLNLAAAQCTGVGYQALYANTGSYNTGFGAEAMTANTTGSDNTSVGRQSMLNSTTGVQNSAFGTQALLSNTTGNGNTGVGAFALGHNLTGVSNVGVGRAAGWYGTTGSNNTSIGYRCGYGNSTGNDGIAIGFYTAHNTLVAEKNTLVGSQADYYVPAQTIVATPSAGAGMAAGIYAYRVAFVLDGVESGQIDSATALATTAGGNLQVTLTVIPTYTGPMSCSARKIYRTPKYVSTIDDNLYYLVATIADNTTTTYVDSTPDGSLGAAPPAHTGSIALGYQATLYKDGQFVAGSTGARITEVYIGGGVNDAAPATVTHSASNASGTNVVGASHRITGGKGTGSASGGATIIAGAPAGSSGSSANPLVDWFSFSAEGYVGIKQVAAANVPTPAAGVCNLFFDTDGSLKFRNPAGALKVVTAV